MTLKSDISKTNINEVKASEYKPYEKLLTIQQKINYKDKYDNRLYYSYYYGKANWNKEPNQLFYLFRGRANYYSLIAGMVDND